MEQGAASGSTNFSPTEFLILKEAIYQNIFIIKKNANKLEKIQKIIGSKNDTPEIRNKMFVLILNKKILSNLLRIKFQIINSDEYSGNYKEHNH